MFCGDGLILALVRDADAPTFYDDLLRYWNSLNDLTGHHLVFAVAGGSAAERVWVGAIHGQRYYSEHMAIAEPNAYGIEQLRLWAGSRRNVEPVVHNLGDANTAQISALCDHLKVGERDLPCLHLTHLESGKCQVLPLSAAPGATVYTACKNIVSQLQQAFRAFDQASIVEALPELLNVQRRIGQLQEQQRDAQQGIYAIEQMLAKPQEAVERDRLGAYFRLRLNERPDSPDARVGELVDLCRNPDRTSEDFGAGKRLVKELALILRLEQKAHRMVNVAFSEPAIRFDVVARENARHIGRREALACSIAEFDAELRALRQQEHQQLHAVRYFPTRDGLAPLRRGLGRLGYASA